MSARESYCFVISPLAESGSHIRQRADKILKHVIRPVCAELNYRCERADEIEEPGLITRRVIRRIVDAPLVIADLTGHNPNVFYEIAVRHATGKPVIQIIEKGEELPFDLFDISTVVVDHRDIDSIEECKSALRTLIASCEKYPLVENPVTASLAGRATTLLSAGKSTIDIVAQFEQMSAQLMAEIASLREERKSLLTRVIELPPPEVRAGAAIADFSASGSWNSNIGLVKLRQFDDDVFGEYAYEEAGWVGNIVGKVRSNFIVFQWRWNDQSFSGNGCWRIGADVLSGGWWYAGAAGPTYPQLLDNPMLGVARLSRLEPSSLWTLRRVKSRPEEGLPGKTGDEPPGE